jgi:hypothetical protein
MFKQQSINPLTTGFLFHISLVKIKQKNHPVPNIMFSFMA